jgi:hypothetical protein
MEETTTSPFRCKKCEYVYDAVEHKSGLQPHCSHTGDLHDMMGDCFKGGLSGTVSCVWKCGLNPFAWNVFCIHYSCCGTYGSLTCPNNPHHDFDFVVESEEKE